MERFQSDESRELFAKVAQFTRYAMQFTPEEVVQLANDRRSKPAGTASRSTADTIGELIEEQLGLGEEIDSSEGRIFFGDALEDVGLIINVIAEAYPDLDDEIVHAVMSDSETIETVALLALRPAEDMRPYIDKILINTGRLSSETSYTVADKSDLAIDSIACPAAGYRATDTYAGEVRPLPIFRELIPWAARVHLLSDEWRDFRKNLEK